MKSNTNDEAFPNQRPHRDVRGAMNSGVNPLLKTLIHALDVGGSNVDGHKKLLWQTHGIRMALALERSGKHQAELERTPCEFARLARMLSSFAHDFLSIKHLVTSELLPRAPQLKRAIKRVTLKLRRVEKAHRSVQKLAMEQELMHAWSVSMVRAVELLGVVFSGGYVSAPNLRLDKVELEVLVLVASNRPVVTIGPARKTARIENETVNKWLKRKR
jgi:hypothetical protein